MPRLFVAVPLADPALAERLAEAQRTLARRSRVKWVAAHQLHFTLKFLGEVPEGRVAAARGALEAGVSGVAPFRLELVGLGAFPRPSAPRVLWAGCGAGREALEELATRVEAAFVKAGFGPETRAFSTHLTLGRLREGGAGRELASLLGREAASEIGAVQVSDAVLYQSILSPAGPAYTALLRVTLSG